MGGQLPQGFENFNDVLYDIDGRFTVKSLKQICTGLHLAIGGTKGILQDRLRRYFDSLLTRNDTARFNLGKSLAETERGYAYGAGRSISRPNGMYASSTASTSSQNNQWGMSSVYQNVRLPVYKRLPFYNVLTNVTQSYNVPACPTSRTTQPIQARLTPEMLTKLQPKGPTNLHRLVLFCTQTDRVHFGNCVIEFPAHAEIRCNGSLVSANLRGIKNKPGTINPPDLTGSSVLMPSVTNKIDVTFAETKSAYTLTVYLVEKMTVDQLVSKIRKKGFMSKETTLNKMKAAAQDADIVPGPETLTLKDPISMTRIDLPCKSRYCGHTACFDAATFLTLNEQTPTWICPICNRSVSTEDDLFLDGYFYDILQNTNKAVESVVIHPDGSWTNKDIDNDHPDAKFLNNPRPSVKLEDRRISMDRKISFGAPKPEIVSLDDDDEDTGAPTPASLPPPQQRTASASASTSLGDSPVLPLTPSSRKRGPPQIVDLTLSDDEDSPPVVTRPIAPPQKRIRVDPPSNSQRSIADSTSSLNRSLNTLLANGVSSASSSMRDTSRETHVRSPPSSISPRNETSTNMFRYNQQPTTLEPQQTQYRSMTDFTLPKTTHLSNPLNAIPSQSSRPQVSSPTLLNRHHPTSSIVRNDTVTTEPRSTSASPVLPAFAPPKNRFTSSANSFSRFDWDAFQQLPESSTARTWDPDRDDVENEDLDLEMARLPSSMFDADGHQDDEDDY